MFITVPLLVIAAALAGLAFIVLRKWPFLKKLEPDAHPVGESFVHDLAPEAMERVRSVHWRSLWRRTLQLVEESLEGVRSLFHAIGQASERLRSSVQSAKSNMPEPEPVQAPEPQVPRVVAPPKDDAAEQQRLLKEEEQRLILDIAQDPKNVNLYVALGKVYAKLGNVADAVESFRTASKLDPDDERITERLQRAQERLEREHERERKFEEEKAAEAAREGEALSEEREQAKEEQDEAGTDQITQEQMP